MLFLTRTRVGCGGGPAEGSPCGIGKAEVQLIAVTLRKGKARTRRQGAANSGPSSYQREPEGQRRKGGIFTSKRK